MLLNRKLPPQKQRMRKFYLGHQGGRRRARRGTSSPSTLTRSRPRGALSLNSVQSVVVSVRVQSSRFITKQSYPISRNLPMPTLPRGRKRMSMLENRQYSKSMPVCAPVVEHGMVTGNTVRVLRVGSEGSMILSVRIAIVIVRMRRSSKQGGGGTQACS